MNTFNKTATLTATMAAVIALSACQSTTPSAPVIQRANSIYETTGIADTKVNAQQIALDNAQKTCQSKQAIIIDDKLTYNGILDESTGRMVGQVGAVVGSILGTGSPDLSRDDDYEYMINFRCQ